ARLVEVLDREDALEHPLQAHVGALVGHHVSLEELLVAVLLDVDQVGDFDGLRDLREGLSDAEVVLDRSRHVAVTPLSCDGPGPRSGPRCVGEWRRQCRSQKMRKIPEPPRPPRLPVDGGTSWSADAPRCARLLTLAST